MDWPVREAPTRKEPTRRIRASYAGRIAAALSLLLSAACGGSRQSPASPSFADPVSVGTFTVEGRVFQLVPREHDPIPGATVTVTSDPRSRQIVTTDGNGHYTVAGITGSAEFEVNAVGYEPHKESWRSAAGSLVYFWLTPILQPDQQRFEADCFFPCSNEGREDVYQVQTRRSGDLIIEVRRVKAQYFLGYQITVTQPR